MDNRVDPVINETNENRMRFAAFCRSLSPAELSAIVPGGSWMVRDYIAHLASIDVYVADWFEHQADGRPWRPKGEDGGAFSIDPWNESRIEERMDASVDDLLAEAAVHRQRLWAAVDRFSPEVRLRSSVARLLGSQCRRL